MEIQKYILKFKFGDAAPDPMRLIFVDPNEITKMTRGMPINHTYGTYILDGDWDQNQAYRDSGTGVMALENYWLWNIVKEYFEGNTDWDKTSGYHQKDKETNHLSLRDIDNEKNNIEELYEKIKTYGYRQQSDLNGKMLDDNGYGLYGMPPEYDEIRINIGRNGELYHDNGKHRFCVARVLDIEEIPVRVRIRHKKWQDIRVKFSKADCLDELDKSIRQYIGHPDLCDVNTHLK